MAVDYAETLRDLDAQIAALEADLAILRTTRPGFVLLRDRQNASIASIPVAPKQGKFARLGNQAAVRQLMADGQLRTRDEIYEQLRDGGFTSEADNPSGSIRATLSQMKDELERVEDRWRKKMLPERVQEACPSVETIRPLTDQFASPPTAWQPPSPAMTLRRSRVNASGLALPLVEARGRLIV